MKLKKNIGYVKETYFHCIAYRVKVINIFAAIHSRQDRGPTLEFFFVFFFLKRANFITHA